MPKYKSILIILIIYLTGFLLFTYNLSEVPGGVYLDEASTGYNAYSILKTGRDEYGKEFPLAFRFFGSYTPPLYTYLTTLPVLIYGLNEFAVRIISALSAAVMISIMYIFLKQDPLVNKNIIYPALLLFIITPWNFFFARTGYEIYLGFLISSLGFLLCWLGLQKKHLLILGLSILSVAAHASHPQMYSVPIFLLTFYIVFRKSINTKSLIVGAILAVLIQLPKVPLLATRAFLNKSDLFYSQEILTNAEKIFLPSIIAIPLSFAFSFFAKTLTYLSPYSLFLLPDPDPQRSIPELSVFYNWMLFPYLIGLYILLTNLKSKFNRFLILLIISSIVPAALTKDPFSTQRGLNLLLPLFLIISFGISYLYEKTGTKIFFIAFAILLITSVTLLWRAYFVFLPSERAITWNYGYKQIAKFISDNPGQNFLVEQIHNKPSYIELAFFLKLNPEVLQNSVDPQIRTNYYNNSKFNPDYKFEKLEIRKIKWEADVYKSQVIIGDELVVSQTQKSEHFLEEVLVINDPPGHPVLKGFKTNPEEKCRNTNYLSEFCNEPKN